MLSISDSRTSAQRRPQLPTRRFERISTGAVFDGRTRAWPNRTCKSTACESPDPSAVADLQPIQPEYRDAAELQTELVCNTKHRFGIRVYVACG